MIARTWRGATRAEDAAAVLVVGAVFLTMERRET